MAEKVSCTSIENYQVHVNTGAHALTADIPQEEGGDGLGPNPFGLLLSSLGACTVITVVHYAGLSKIALEKVWLDLEGQYDKEKKTYQVQGRMRVRGELDDEDMKRLAGYAKRCHVHQVLTHGAEIQINVEQV